jgi:LmbE family N-acetylglucosaminyl deacetylase
MERVLAFGCHPDDIEFQAAGTLALLAQRGCEIHLATMAGGEVGSPDLRPQDIRAKRLKEAAASAAVLGGRYHYAGGHDLEIEYCQAQRRQAVRVLREVDPQIVLTHPPSDYLIDHEETHRLVRNAAFIASVPLFDCGVPRRTSSAAPCPCTSGWMSHRSWTPRCECWPPTSRSASGWPSSTSGTPTSRT